MTISEELFERFCEEAEIPWERVQEGEERRPDYVVRPAGHQVIAEVKQFEPSSEEIELERQLHQGEPVSVDMSPPGRRIRQAIGSGYPQLASLAKGSSPALLVVYNNFFVADHTDPYHIKTGMFGLEAIDIAVPKDYSRSPYATERRFGGKRKVTTTHNRSLSAVGRLCRTEDSIYLQVFHNPFAAIPLPVEWMQNPRILHYRISEKNPGEFQDWELITPGDPEACGTEE